MTTTALPTHVRASNVGAMLGCDPRMSPLALFHDMRGSLPEREDEEILQEGREFEDAIGRIAAKKFKMAVLETGGLKLVHGSLSGHPDRQFSRDGEQGVLEIKNALRIGEGGFGDPGSDQVPRHYWLQCQTYVHLWRLTAGVERASSSWGAAPYALLAANLRSGTELFQIQHDPEVCAKIEEEAARFLHRVHENDPPQPRDEEDMRRRWLVDEKKIIVGNEEIFVALEQIKALSQQVREAEKAISGLKTMVLGFAQDAACIIDDKGVVRADLNANRVFDEELFKQMAPDVVTQCMKLDKTAAKKLAASVYDKCMRRPESVHEQVRVIRVKELT